MCVLVVRFQVVPGTPLVVAGNRDEKVDRPAEPMAVLREDPRTLGGRDLVAGGTWLAVNEHGVVAGLTNQPMPDGADPAKRTRGELPLALTAERSARAGVEAFAAGHRPGDYNPAWLLVGDRESLFALDMSGDAVSVRELAAGTHVLENRAYGEPSAKVTLVLDDLAAGGLDVAMADHRIPEEPDVEERYRPYRATCVHTDDFGTRWSGVVTVPDEGLPTFRYTDGPPCTTPFVDYFWGSRSE